MKLQCPSSQTHRVVEAGQDLGRPSGPTSLLKQGYPEQAAQDHI